jgi:SAM-dependent methyltransferase
VSRTTNYDAVADGYDVRYRSYDYREIKEGLYAFLGDEPLGAILEVGCGTGFWLRALSGRAKRIAGVDFSAEMIVRAKGSGASLVRARAESLPWTPGSFDRIVCINALHHFVDRDAFFAEALRTLTPDGGVIVVGLDPHAGRDSWWIYDYFPEAVAIDLQRYPAVKTIRAEMARAGFTSAESSEIQTFEHVMTAAQAFERGLVARSFSSQLAVLTDAEFDAGVARLRKAMGDASASGAELQLVSELHLFAVVGRVGAG